MRSSLTFRLTWQFAALVTLTTALVLTAGGWLLRRQGVSGLEIMHDLQARELAELLGHQPQLTAPEIAQRIDEAKDSDLSQYFIQVHNDRGNVLYRSKNLGDAILPELPAQDPHGTAQLAEIGAVRVTEIYAGHWHILVASPLTPVERLLRDYGRMSGFLVLGVAFVSVGLGYGFSRITLQPLRAIEQTARRIGADNLRERIPMPTSRDELADLTALLNQMFDRIEHSFQQVQRFTADASHELKTPLALIRLNAERLRQRVAQDHESSAGFADLLEEIGRMHHIIDSLLFLAKAESGVLALQLKPQEVGALLAPLAEDAQVLAEDRGVQFVWVGASTGTLRLEPALFRQLLLNLVGNALNVSAPGSRVELSAEHTESGWRFTVTDEGPGLPAELLEKVFQRFVRYEPTSGGKHHPGGGHGLGLAICRSIAELHGGVIRAENRTDGQSGLHVRVELPG